MSIIVIQLCLIRSIFSTVLLYSKGRYNFFFEQTNSSYLYFGNVLILIRSISYSIQSHIFLIGIHNLLKTKSYSISLLAITVEYPYIVQSLKVYLPSNIILYCFIKLNIMSQHNHKTIRSFRFVKVG